MDTGTIKAGDWVLCESVLMDRLFSHPAEVVKVSGKRVYVRRPCRNRDGVIEDWDESFKSIKTVRRVVRDEAHGMEIFEAERKAHEEYQLAAGDLRRAYIKTRDAAVLNLA